MAVDPRRVLLDQHMRGVAVYTEPGEVDGVGEEARKRVLAAIEINKQELLDRFMQFLEAEVALVRDEEQRKLAREVKRECVKLRKQRKNVATNLCIHMDQKYLLQ